MRTDGRTEMTLLTGALRDYANAPKHILHQSRGEFCNATKPVIIVTGKQFIVHNPKIPRYEISVWHVMSRSLLWVSWLSCDQIIYEVNVCSLSSSDVKCRVDTARCISLYLGGRREVPYNNKIFQRGNQRGGSESHDMYQVIRDWNVDSLPTTAYCMYKETYTDVLCAILLIKPFFLIVLRMPLWRLRLVLP
jgi:hypothetical protein